MQEKLPHREVVVRTSDESAIISYLRGVQDQSPKKHIVYIDSMEPNEYFDFDEAANEFKLTLNKGYFARAPQQKIDTYSSIYRQRLLNGDRLESDSVYVIDYPETIELAKENPHYDLLHVGKYVFLKEK